jgi:hypothetical protein
MKQRTFALTLSICLGVAGALLMAGSAAGQACPSDTCQWNMRSPNEEYWGCCEVGYQCKDVYSFNVACVVAPEEPFQGGTAYRFVDGFYPSSCVGGGPPGCA